MSSASTSTFCSACGARLGSTDRFCHTCGAAASRETRTSDGEADTAVGDTTSTVVRKVVTKTGDEVLDQAVSAGVGGVVGLIGPFVASLVPSLLLTLTSSGRGFVEWFALTWPLTLAAAAIVVVAKRVTKGSGTIVPIGIIILLVATVLGVNLAGTPINLTGMPTGWLAVTIFLLQGLLHAFGPLAFVLSIVAGVLAGTMLNRVTNVAISSVSKAANPS